MVRRISVLGHGLAAACLVLGLAPLGASATENPNGKAAKIADYWTKERRAAAIPRDLRIDSRGYGYLRRADGKLVPYGHQVAALAQDQGGMAPQAGPGGGDTTPPSISGMVPSAGTTIGASFTFSATVTDTSGVKSVSVVVGRTGGATQSFAATQGANNQWSVALQGFTNGAWSWHVVAKDKAKPGNTQTSDSVGFTVDTGGGGGGGGGGTVTNAQWTFGGDVQTAVGRIYFEMPSNSRKTRWSGYVCSGTVATDNASGRSVIITAAHCVYDDAYKAFARNVLFIPNQAGTSGTGTDLDCSNDPLGCWTPAYGVVDVDWTTRTFPNNVAWDYAYYVVNDTGAHSGAGGGSSIALDSTAGSLAPDFTEPDHDTTGALTHALGYSYSDDPNFMYCAEDMETAAGGDDWWLPSCDLSGGSSGGSWVQPMDTGTGRGPIISVNSWGYTNSPGMAGPFLNGTSAACIFDQARMFLPVTPPSTADGLEGVAVSDSTCNQQP